MANDIFSDLTADQQEVVEQFRACATELQRIFDLRMDGIEVPDYETRREYQLHNTSLLATQLEAAGVEIAFINKDDQLYKPEQPQFSDRDSVVGLYQYTYSVLRMATEIERRQPQYNDLFLPSMVFARKNPNGTYNAEYVLPAPSGPK